MMYNFSEQNTDDMVTYHSLNIPSDLIYDKSYSFYRTTTIFCFAFILISVNLIIFDKLRFLTS